MGTLFIVILKFAEHMFFRAKGQRGKVVQRAKHHGALALWFPISNWTVVTQVFISLNDYQNPIVSIYSSCLDI